MVMNWLTLLLYRFHTPGFYFKGQSNRKVIYLTIDDGPNDNTPNLLHWMNENQIQATHFWLGEKIKQRPTVFSQLGSQFVAFHGYTHRKYSRLSDFEIQEELTQLDSLQVLHLPEFQTWFRPPYGAWNPGLNKKLTQKGFHLIFWNFMFKDWLPDFSPDEINRRKKEWLKNGVVLVFHDKPEYKERLKESLLRVKLICTEHNFELSCLPSLK